MVQRIVKVSNQNIRDISFTISRNSFFAHPENALILMLADDDSDIRQLASIKFYQVEKAERSFLKEVILLVVASSSKMTLTAVFNPADQCCAQVFVTKVEVQSKVASQTCCTR